MAVNTADKTTMVTATSQTSLLRSGMVHVPLSTTITPFQALISPSFPLAVTLISPSFTLALILS